MKDIISQTKQNKSNKQIMYVFMYMPKRPSLRYSITILLNAFVFFIQIYKEFQCVRFLAKDFYIYIYMYMYIPTMTYIL